ncbi:uncharacterized protein DEA37_0008936 [Paragonimus westermani]|uniref:Baculoviral IAP repeat-containing protein 2 n=2 Tax=Paragonimus westermani TaxID=34504 RepID=A0A5J4NM03_9TREM|nr:uncharacterized protein DEA37_0008936 [Paragonimus westermani]
MEVVARVTVPGGSPLPHICYFPPLNVIAAASSNGCLSLIDGSNGRLIRKSTFSGNSSTTPTNLCYFGGRESLVVARGCLFNARTHTKDMFLLEDIFCGPVKKPDDTITLEFNSEQSTLIDAILTSDTSYHSILRDGEVVITRHDVDCVRDTKWKTMTLTGPLSVIEKWSQSILRGGTNCDQTPLSFLVSSIGSRLLRLRTSDSMIITLNHRRNNSLMHMEAHRRLTFANWPHMGYRWATPEAMAQAGFYYPQSKVDDHVLCFTCNVCLTNWEPTDEPWSEHSRHAISCPFVLSKPTKNVSITGKSC